MNPLSKNRNLARDYATKKITLPTYITHPGLVVDKLPLRKLENISRNLEGIKRTDQRNIVDIDSKISDMVSERLYKEVVSFIQELIVQLVEIKLQELGYRDLKAYSTKEKFVWYARYQMIDEMVFKNIADFIELNVSQTLKDRLRSKTGDRGVDLDVVEDAIRHLIQFLEYDKLKDKRDLKYEPALLGLKEILGRLPSNPYSHMIDRLKFL